MGDNATYKSRKLGPVILGSSAAISYDASLFIVIKRDNRSGYQQGTKCPYAAGTARNLSPYPTPLPSFCRRSMSALTPHDPVPPSSDTAQSQKQGENFDNHEMYIGSTSRLPLPSFYHRPASSYSPYTLTNKLVSTLARRAELPTRKCRRIKDRNRHPGHVRTPS